MLKAKSKLKELENPKRVSTLMIVIQSGLVTCTKAKCPNKYQKMLPALKLYQGKREKTYVYTMGDGCIKCPYREDQWQLVLDNVPWEKDQWQSEEVWEQLRKRKEDARS